MSPEEIKQLIKEYITEKLDVSVSRDGYNDELILVSITLDGEEIASDTVRIS